MKHLTGQTNLQLILAVGVAFLFTGVLQAQVLLDNPKELESVEVEERLGERVSLDLEFTDSRGKRVTLRDYLKNDKPLLLNLAYYNCPMLCTLVLNGVRDTVRELSLQPGKDFNMVVVSIDPTEEPPLAAEKQANYIESLLENRRAASKQAKPEWHFLVAAKPAGEKSAAEILSEELGFNYTYDEETKQYAHPSVTFLITPDGKISRYLYGIAHRKRDLRMALVEASEGKIGTTVDKVLLYCYRYDPDARGYVLFAQNLMKLGGALTIIALSIFLGFFWSRETLLRKKRDNEAHSKDKERLAS